MNLQHPSEESSPVRHVVMVGDHFQEIETSLEELNQAGFDLKADRVTSPQDIKEHLQQHPCDLVLADYGGQGEAKPDLLTIVRELHPDVPFIYVTEEPGEELRQECLLQGADDLVGRGDPAALPEVVRRLLEQQPLRRALRHATDQMLRGEEAWRALASKISDSLFIECEGRIVFANDSVAQLLDVASGESMIDKPATSVFHPVDRDTVETHLQGDGQREVPETFPASLQRADGNPLDAEVTVVGTYWEGRPARQFLLRDLTGPKQLESTINSLAAFAQYSPDPVLEFTDEGILTYFNQAATDMAVALGKNSPHEVLPPETKDIVRTCLASGMDKAPLETTQSGRTYSWSFHPVPSKKSVHCYVSEVTDRQVLEAQLRHSQKLESIGRLASGVAHDFNNILTVIQGHIGLMKSSPELNSVTQDSLNQVSQAAERARRLTSQLLAFSRKTEMHPTRLDLNETLTNISMMLNRTLGEDINYQFCYAPGLPYVYADVGMLEQLIMILAVNARDAMPRGGQLIISTSLAELNEGQAKRNPDARVGEFVCLTMIDGGSGMDDVTLGRLFEPFFTTKEFGKGTGLGLAVVDGIVKQHEGWIEVQSMVGQGTTFKIFLPPCTPEQEDSAQVPSGSAIPGGNETVLLVEDEPPVRWIVRNVLERYGYKVLEAGNGVEALAIWHQHHDGIDLLLTDMVMPVGLSGQELAEKCHHNKPGLKVIFTSGYSAQVATQDLPLIDGLDFLQKPFDADKLALAVRNCLDR